MNHLRLREGFQEFMFAERTGLPISALEPALSQCLEDALLEHVDGFIRCTEQGWNFLDTVLEKFLNIMR